MSCPVHGHCAWEGKDLGSNCLYSYIGILLARFLHVFSFVSSVFSLAPCIYSFTACLYLSLHPHIFSFISPACFLHFDSRAWYSSIIYRSVLRSFGTSGLCRSSLIFPAPALAVLLFCNILPASRLGLSSHPHLHLALQ